MASATYQVLQKDFIEISLPELVSIESKLKS